MNCDMVIIVICSVVFIVLTLVSAAKLRNYWLSFSDIAPACWSLIKSLPRPFYIICVI
jgi:hypothetical protein